MIFKKKNANTKTIYYVMVKTLEVPDNATDQEIDDLVCQQLTEPVDYMWSEKADFLWDD